MLVAHVVNNLAAGGSERQLLQLVEQSELEHEIIQLDALGRSRRGAVPALGRRLRTLQPDLVCAWLERPQLAVALTPPPATPLVACVRGHFTRTRWERWIYAWALARYDLLVTNSRDLLRMTTDFARPFSLAQFHVIPNGVKPAPPIVRAAREHRQLRIGFIGRGTFDADKGLDVLLRALALMPPSEVEVVLVGKGVEESLADAGNLQHRVEAYPPVEDPWTKLAAVDALVVPSRREGSPNVVLEAFSRRLPVVATAVGGSVELLADGRGLLVPPDDPAGLVAALREVAASPAPARERADRAFAYVQRTHAWPRVVAAYDSLFLQARLRRLPRPRSPI